MKSKGNLFDTIMSSTWSIEAWCAEQTVDKPLLQTSAEDFLNALPNASAQHPFCSQFTDATYGIPGCPAQGPLIHKDHLETFYDILVTTFAISVPSLLAMAELWLRLFASLIAPVGILHQVYLATGATRNPFAPLWIKVITAASSIVLFTDTLYVYEFGASYGGILLLASLVLGSYTTSPARKRIWELVRASLIVLTAILIVQPDGSLQWGDAKDIPYNVPEGLYYDNATSSAENIVRHWNPSTRTYNRPTPYFPTGDSRTGLPFLIHKLEKVPWVRRWLPMESDGEVVALDIAFPTNAAGEFYHDSSQPLYVVFHGLNGGSKEEYVRDFALQSVGKGSTVVVMVARGLMDLPVRGWNIFHGARWTDAFESISAVRHAVGKEQFIAGVGYSMGAIVLGNVLTRQPPLDAAVAISGGLDMRNEVDFERAMRLWQPLIVGELRDTFVVGKWGERVRERLTRKELKSLMRASHVTGVDKAAVVAYNGYRDVLEYYAEMSALGDVPYAEYENEPHFHPSRRILKINVPFCVVHALDDPLVTWRSVASNEQGLLHPTRLTKENPNIFLMLTKRGGHVGWPTGWLPHVDKWKWMSAVPAGFISAVVKSRQ